MLLTKITTVFKKFNIWGEFSNPAGVVMDRVLRNSPLPAALPWTPISIVLVKAEFYVVDTGNDRVPEI